MYTSYDPDLPASCGQRMLKEGQSIKSSLWQPPSLTKHIEKWETWKLGNENHHLAMPQNPGAIGTLK